MRHILHIFILSLILPLFLSSQAYGIFGSDGKREGFIAGASMGFGGCNMAQEMGSLSSYSWTTGWQFRMRIGKGLNERTMLTLSSRLSLYDWDNIDTIAFESDMFDSMEE